MKRRITQVTRITKTVDARLSRLDERLSRIENYIDKLEKLIEKKQEKSESPKTITYTIN